MLSLLLFIYKDYSVQIDPISVKFSLFALILASIVAYIVNRSFYYYKLGRLKILNAQLKYIPSGSEINKLSAFKRFVIIPLAYPGVILNLTAMLIVALLSGGLFKLYFKLPGSININPIYHIIATKCIISVLIIFSILLAWLFMLKCIKSDLKGLVGILDTDFKAVLDNSYDHNDQIHFAQCSKTDENGRIANISYEKRIPIKDKEEIEKIREIIVDHYTELKNKIVADECIPHHLFDVNYYDDKQKTTLTLHICDFLKDYAYSLESLMEAIDKVDSKMHSEHLINFIGNKIGISDYEINDHKLKLITYNTDHFTFHVFKEIFLDIKYKEVFQLFIRRVNLVDYNTRKYMVRCLKYLFSSFGIDVIINTRNTRGKRVMLAGLRNGAIERLGNDKLHVPVNESFSDTDFNEDEDELSPLLCVQRGIVEELGIPMDVVQKATIEFHDFAIVSDEGEIGLSCNADFSSVMPIEQMRCYPGQDKFIENKNLIELPYPPFYWDKDKYPLYFYKKTNNDALCTPWESFTPIIFQRSVVRRSKLNEVIKLVLNILLLSLLTPFFFYFCRIDIEAIFNHFFSTTLIPFIWNFAIQLISYFINAIRYCQYSYIMPLIPQWNGDVRVCQCNDHLRVNFGGDGVRENPIASKLYFGIHTDKDLELDWKDLRLIEPPYCYVRREVTGHKEYPISFYRIAQNINNKSKNKLIFYKIPFYSDNEGYITFNLHVVGNKRFYKFTQELSSQKLNPLKFRDCFDKDETLSLCRYFGIDTTDFQSLKKGLLDDDFQNKYVPMDLMEYQGNYYWSLYELRPTIPKNPIKINKSTNLFKQYIKDVTDDTSLCFKCKKEDIVSILSSFIAHPENRKRIPSIDIYMLQLALIRKESGCEELLAIKKRHKLFWLSSLIK